MESLAVDEEGKKWSGFRWQSANTDHACHCECKRDRHRSCIQGTNSLGFKYRLRDSVILEESPWERTVYFPETHAC